MKPHVFCAIWVALLAAPPLAAEVQVRLNIVFILGPNDEFPSNPPLNSQQAVRDNIEFINGLLGRRGESFRVFLRNNVIHTVSGQSDPWFDIDARNKDNANLLESTATANDDAKVTWHWHDDSINIYINDSSSGVCSFPGGGNIIFVGANSFETTLIHEIGHFLSLRHTHLGDSDDVVDDWTDGDGFLETLDDEPDATPAHINNRYPQFLQTTRDDLIFNIMSYHQPRNRFVWQQRQAIIETYNGSRDDQASRATSANYTNDGSAGLIAGVSSVAAPAETAKHGYIAQLFEVTGLVVNAAPPSVNETATRQLTAQQLLDDATFLAVPATSVSWGVVSGPITGITAAGLATTGTVFQATPASVQGVFAGNTGSLNLTVLDTISDNFGAYAGDGVGDDWQAQYFGQPPNALAAPLLDPDGDGQNNAFEFTAGLIPTDPGSRFQLRIEKVPGQPGQRNVIFSPRLTDRTYTLHIVTLQERSWKKCLLRG